MKNVLYISYDGMTDSLGQSQVLPYLRGLSEKGYRFTLISFEKPGRFEENREVIESITKEAEIDWHPLMYTKKPPILSTVRDVRKMEALALKLHRERSFDLVHCRGYIPALTGLYLKRKFGVPFLFDMRGFWANEKVDAGAWKLSNPLFRAVYQFFKKKEKSFLEAADHVISLTHKGKEEMKNWNHVQLDMDKVSVIPCCVDTAHFDGTKLDHHKREELRKSLGIAPEEKLLSYLGSIGTWYMLNEMLDFFVEFRKKYGHSKLLFITQDEHDRIREEARKRGLVDHIVIRPGRRAEVPMLLSLSDLSLFFIRPTYSKMSSSPTKQGEIMAMGIPVICNAGIGDTDKIVLDYQSGRLVETMSPESYAKAIQQLEQSSFEPAAIRQGALEYFSLDKGVESYHRIYQQIFTGNIKKQNQKLMNA